MTSIGASLNRLFNLEPGEGRLVSLLSLHHFFQGFGIALLTIVATAEFLSNYPIYKLPEIYLLSSGALVLTGRIYAFLEHRLKLNLLFRLIIIAMTAVMVFCWAGMTFTDSMTFSIVLMVAFRVIYLLGSLEFWGLSALIFNVRQGKRLFGLISAGDVPAKLLGYLSVSVLVPVLGTENLILVCGASFLISLFFMQMVIRSNQLPAPGHHDSHHHHPHGNVIQRLFGADFIIAMAVLSAIAVVSLTLIDFSFYSGVKKRFHDDLELATFLGFFFAAGKTVTIILKLFFSGRIVSRFGIRKSLIALPAVLIVVAMIPVAGQITGLTDQTIFWVFGLLMLLSEVMSYALHTPVFLALFQPLDQHRRLQGHTIVKGLTDALSLGLAGGILMFLMRKPGSAESLMSVTYVLLFFLGAWIVSVLWVNRKYLAVLKSAVKNRFLAGKQIGILDGQSVQFLKEKLNSKYPEEVIYTLELLRNAEVAGFKEILIEMLGHQEEAVVLRAVSLLEETGAKGAGEALLQLVAENRSESITTAAIRVLCSVSDDAADKIVPYLEADSAAVRTGAILGLIRTGEIEKIVLAGEALLRWIDSEEKQDRILALKVLGELKIKKFYKPVQRLLNDGEEAVRIAAIRAAGAIANGTLMDALMPMLKDEAVQLKVLKVLPAFGEAALPGISRAIDQDAELPFRIRLDLIRICGSIPCKAGHEYLSGLAMRQGIPAAFKTEALNALYHAGYTDLKDSWRDQLNREFTFWETCYGMQMVLSRDEADLKEALEGEMKKSVKRMHYLLTFMYDREPIDKAMDGFEASSAEAFANALEILDNQLPNRISDRLIPILRTMDEQVPYSLSHARFADKEKAIAQILDEGLNQFGIWTVALALQKAKTVSPKLRQYYMEHPMLILQQVAGTENQITEGHGAQ